MYVCLCCGISDKALIRLIQSKSIRDLKTLRRCSPIGSQCGKCLKQANALLCTETGASLKSSSSS